MNASVKLSLSDGPRMASPQAEWQLLPIPLAIPASAWTPTQINSPQKMWGGSGTIVHVEGGQALILTNKHVVSRPCDITVHWYNGHSVRGTFLACDDRADLGAILIDAPAGTPFVPVSRTRPPVGTVIAQAGYPGPKRVLEKRTAQVVRYSGYGPGVYNLDLNFVSRPGDSGSGVFLPKEKTLCGVVWGGNGSGAVAVEQAHVYSFYLSCFERWKKKPPGPTQPPGSPPGNPGPPPVTPPPVTPPGIPGMPPVEPPSIPVPPPAPDRAIIDGLLKRLEALEKVEPSKAFDKIHNELERAKSILGLLENGLTDLRASGAITKERADSLGSKLDFVSNLVDKADGKIDAKLLEKLGPFIGMAKEALLAAKGADGKADLVAVLADGAAKLGKDAGGWSALLPYLAGGSVAGPIGLGLSILALYRRFGKGRGAGGLLVTDDLIAKFTAALNGRRGEQPVQPVAQQQQPSVNVPQPVVVSGGVQQRLPDVVVQQGPIQESRYVEVPAKNGYLEALQKMMDETASHNPGARDMIDALKSGAQQIYSGMKK